MAKRTIELADNLDDDLKREAKRLGVPPVQIVRDAVSRALGRAELQSEVEDLRQEIHDEMARHADELAKLRGVVARIDRAVRR